MKLFEKPDAEPMHRTIKRQLSIDKKGKQYVSLKNFLLRTKAFSGNFLSDLIFHIDLNDDDALQNVIQILASPT